MHKKLLLRVTLLRRLNTEGSGWGAGTKTLRTAALSRAYSTAKYCTPVWSCSAHTRLIDSVLNNAFCIIVNECLHPTPTDYLPIASRIQPAELRRLGASWLPWLTVDFWILIIFCIVYALQERLRFRRPFVPASRNLLDNLAGLGIRASEKTNHKWNAEYCENTSTLRVFVPGTSTRPVGMSLHRAAWVKLNRLRTGVRRFYLSMHKCGLAPSSNCDCNAAEQTAHHVLKACPIHRASYGTRGLTVLDDET